MNHDNHSKTFHPTKFSDQLGTIECDCGEQVWLVYSTYDPQSQDRIINGSIPFDRPTD